MCLQEGAKYTNGWQMKRGFGEPVKRSKLFWNTPVKLKRMVNFW